MGVLTGVQELQTEEIPRMVRRGTACWEGGTCVNFATELLGWLRGVVKEEGRVYRVRMGRKAGVVEVREEGVGDGGIVSGEWRAWREEMKGRGRGQEGEKVEGKVGEKEKEKEEGKVDGEA